MRYEGRLQSPDEAREEVAKTNGNAYLLTDKISDGFLGSLARRVSIRRELRETQQCANNRGSSVRLSIIACIVCGEGKGEGKGEGDEVDECRDCESESPKVLHTECVSCIDNETSVRSRV